MKSLLVILFLSVAVGSLSLHAQEFYSSRSLGHERDVFRRSVDDSILRWKRADIVDRRAVLGTVWRIAAFNRYDKAQRVVNSLINGFASMDSTCQYAVLSLIYDRCEDLNSKQLQSMVRSVKGCRNAELLAATVSKREGRVSGDDYELDSLMFESLKRATINRGIPVLLLRSDRNLPGSMLLPQADGTIVTLPFLGRSAYNTPSSFRNGNTPCGVYAVKGWSASDNVFIGPVPTLITELPFEASPADFGLAETSWSEDVYSSLFPEIMRDNDMIKQAYVAGKNGRAEIIVHGSTIDPRFFVGTSFYPLTPSMGCMTALEIWNIQTGTPIENVDSQLKLKEYLMPNTKFLYVVQVKQQIISQYQ